jgi:L-cysteine desulfidase
VAFAGSPASRENHLKTFDPNLEN